MRNGLLGFIQSASLFIARLALAAVFVPAGWGKLQSLDRPINFFQTLNIPFPSVMAPVVASFELVCGITLLLGIFTRLSAIPIVAIMTVAIITAKMNDVNKLTDLSDITEFLYIVLALLLIAFGSGRIAFDQLRLKR